jgi:serine/threonine-protein kinase
MEYVPGRRLDVWASTENPSAREVVRKLLGVAQALAATHRVKVVHRDVKEANILVRDDTGEVVLVDFGVGSDEEASWRTGGVLPPATPDYRSPEAWLFEKENKDRPGAHYRPAPSDDLYALGVVLYWLLTNRRPFYVEGRKGVEAVLTEAPKPAHLLNPRVPVELSELCLRLLAKKPEKRPPDAQALCTALTELLERQEAAWEGPLCETFNEHTLTTRPGPGADELVLWVKEAREAQARPRRGRRPLVLVEDAPPAPVAGAAPAPPPPEPGAAASPSAPSLMAPAPGDLPKAPDAHPVEPVAPAPEGLVSAPAQVPPSSTSVEEHQVLARATSISLWVAVVLLLAAVVGMAAVQLGTLHPRPIATSPIAPIAPGARLFPAVPETFGETTWQVGEIGWEVATPVKPPEADRDNSFTVAEASVKNPQQEQQKQQKVLAPVAKTIITGIACLGVACTGPQVRPTPPPEECPPGAVEAMEKFRIKLGDEGVAAFHAEGDPRPIAVREGWTSVRLPVRWKGLPPDTSLVGKLIFGGERVYGRFTEARLPEGGGTVRVCVEVWEERKPGTPIWPGSTAGNVKVGSGLSVRAVERFGPEE